MKSFASLLVALVCAASVPVLANSRLVTSVPEKNSTVSVSPEKLLLMFAEPVELTSLTLQKAGDRAPLRIHALPELPGRPLVVELPKLAAGEYTVTYWITNSNLRESRGSFAFMVDSSPEWPRARRFTEVTSNVRK
jgi:methionine-rich copper-binding protein CopC